MLKEIILVAVSGYGVVLVMMLADLITGVAKAFKKHNLKSAGLRNSLHKAIIYFIILVIGGCLKYAGEASISAVFLAFLCLVEGVSVLENLAEISPNMPLIKRLSKFLENKSEEKLN